MAAASDPEQQTCVATAAVPTPCIVFPAADAGPLRNVASTALVLLRDGSARCVRLTATAWTPERVATVARALGFVDGGRPTAPMLKALARELGDATLALVNVALDAVDPAAWDLRRIASARVARAAAADPAPWTPADARRQAEALERRWHADLEARLAHFVAGLAPEAVASARALGRFDTDVYNFLVRAPRPAWRRQFVRTFPALVHEAVAGGPGSLGAFVRDAVDRGLPLVAALARRWSVGEAAVRALVAVPMTHVGARWQRAPHQLARVLDVLCPEDRPRDALAWQRFHEAVASAEAVFRRPAEACPLTLGWIRRGVRRGFASGERGHALSPDAVAAIDRLRAALVAHLAAVSEAAGGRAAATADRGLAALPAARLAAAARKFGPAEAARRAAREADEQRAAARAFWPLLPAPLVAADGRHAVVPLTALAALRDEGAAQTLCIAGGAELADLAHDCAAGDAYVLSIRDAATGARLSTAEVRLTRRYGIGAPRLHVIQHKGRGNGRPPAGCAQALREALAWAGTPAGERHRQAGAAAVAGDDDGVLQRAADDGAAARRGALAVALGEALLARCEAGALRETDCG